MARFVSFQLLIGGTVLAAPGVSVVVMDVCYRIGPVRSYRTADDRGATLLMGLCAGELAPAI